MILDVLWRRPARERREAGDSGTMLVELIVGMALMSIFMALFTGAVVMMHGTVNKVDSVTDSQNQVNQAFLTLDKQVRYASAVSTPGIAAGSWYVELLNTYTGTSTCAQLRLSPTKQQLQERTWTVLNGTDTNVSGWRPLASNLTNGNASAGSSNQPFVLNKPFRDTDPQPKTTPAFPRLTVTLVSTAGTSSPTTTRATMTFAMINSASTSAASVCQGEGRP